MPTLTERGITAAKARERVCRLSDGNGLLLEVRTAGGKALLFRFMLQGRRRDMGLGSYPATGLAAARRKAAEAAQLALRFGILTAVRSAEVRNACWSELDFGTMVWTIPAERMKGGRAKAMPLHRVPLSEVMLARAAVVQTGQATQPAAQTALGACIRRMNEAAPAGTALPWRDVDGR